LIFSVFLKAGYNVRALNRSEVTIALDETTLLEDVHALVRAVTGKTARLPTSTAPLSQSGAYAHLRRTTAYLTHPTFNKHHSETEMLRYLYSLQQKDLSLASAMIPLGSCTMKLNATSEMIPVTWPQFSKMHPFAPKKQAQGYAKMAKQLEEVLASVTGFDAVSLQPNSGAQGE
jgi:glycine dehydrogenase